MEEVTVSDQPEYQAAIGAIDSVIAGLHSEIADIERKIEALQADKTRLSRLVGRETAENDTESPSTQPQRPAEIEDLPAALRTYARPVVGKERTMSLRSAEMVADVVASFDHPVTRKEIIARFFDRFPRQHLEQVWQGDVDGAVAIAVRRAAQRGLIEKADRNLYTSPSEGDSQT